MQSDKLPPVQLKRGRPYCLVVIGVSNFGCTLTHIVSLFQGKPDELEKKAEISNATS